MNRRKFLKNSSLLSAAPLIPGFLTEMRPYGRTMAEKRLVIIQLSGGNDGLNTVVPFRNDDYYRMRPSLGIPREEVLPLTDDLGLNPAMEGLRHLYDQGWVNVINGVGYPNPNRSHFRSLDIWHTASNADEYWQTGWLGRYLDHACQGCSTSHRVVEVDDTLSLAVKGAGQSALAMKDPEKLFRATQAPFVRDLQEAYGRSGGGKPPLDYLYKTLAATCESAAYLHQQLKKPSHSATYPATELGRELKMIASLMIAGAETRVYYVSLSGFDTHVRQKNQQERLLKQYSEAVHAFVSDLNSQGLFEDTLIMTFSEFGRRVEENASGGTDHGKANNLFLIGSRLKQPGILAGNPDLRRLDEGDLVYQVDFRRIYAELISRWLEADAEAILGRKFDPLRLV